MQQIISFLKKNTQKNQNNKNQQDFEIKIRKK